MIQHAGLYQCRAVCVKVYAIEGPPMRVRYARRLQHEMLARTYEDACNVEGSAIEDMWRAIFCCDVSEALPALHYLPLIACNPSTEPFVSQHDEAWHW